MLLATLSVLSWALAIVLLMGRFSGGIERSFPSMTQPVLLSLAASATNRLSHGLCRGRTELCHGFVEAIHRLSVLVIDIDSSDLSLSSSDCDQPQDSDRCESHAEWFHRVASKHDSGSVAPAQPPSSMPCGDDLHGNVRPLRLKSQTVFYVPSPSGFAIDEVSSDEYHAALYDSSLDDASVASSDGHESDVSCASIDVDFNELSLEPVACVAIFVGQYLMGGTTYPFWLPSTPIQDNESGIVAAKRLVLDMLFDTHGLVDALVRPTGLEFTSSGYPVRISLFTMHLSADADRSSINSAVQQSMPRWYSNCGSLNWYGFADSISESAQMSELCNMAFEYLLNSRLICFYAADLVHSWRSQVFGTTHMFGTTHSGNSLMVESSNSPYTPHMAYIRLTLHRILSLRLQNVIAAWQTEMANALFEYQMELTDSIALPSADGHGETLEELNKPCRWMLETPDSPSDSEGSVSSDVSLCDEHPCTCVCGSQAAANTLSLTNAQLAAAIDTLRLHDEAEALVSNQPSNSTTGPDHYIDSDTSHAYHTLLVEASTLRLGSACLSCSDRGLFLCDRGLCNACCEMSGCICEIPDLCNLDAKSTTTSSSSLPALESATQIRADLVEALDLALYVNEAAEFQQKPCTCDSPPQRTMGPSDGCMFCCDQTVRCAACTSACMADGDAIDIASALVSSPVSGPFASIQAGPAGPLQNIHTDADGVQWIDTANAVHHYSDAAHPNFVHPHHQVPYSVPNAAQHFAHDQHFDNLYHHPPFGVIPEGWLC